jgi:hypothetical protein
VVRVVACASLSCPPMLDVLFLILVVAFFALAFASVRAAERL